MLEIGTFLGLSTRLWLNCDPELTVICVDPWISPKAHEWTESWALKGWPEIHHKVIHDLFLSSNWDYRDRIIPIRGASPDELGAVHACGVEPDLIYVDGDHSYEGVMKDLTECYRLFPNALLTGDDWNWDKHFCPPQSVREAVIEFSEARDWSVQSKKNTWVKNTWVMIGTGRHAATQSPSRNRWDLSRFLFGKKVPA